MATANTSASYFSGIRFADKSTVIIKFGTNKAVTTSQGFTRPLDVARWKKANEDVAEYLRLLLNLTAKPTATTDLAFKSAVTDVATTIKAGATQRLTGADFPDMAEAIDNAYAAESDAKLNYQTAKAERMALVALSKGTKAVKAPTKTELKAEIAKLIQSGNAADVTPEMFAAAGFLPTAKATK